MSCLVLRVFCFSHSNYFQKKYTHFGTSLQDLLFREKFYLAYQWMAEAQREGPQSFCKYVFMSAGMGAMRRIGAFVIG